MIEIESENQMKMRKNLEKIVELLDHIRMHEGCEGLTIEVTRNSASVMMREGTKHKEYFDLKEVDKARKSADELMLSLETARAIAVTLNEQLWCLKKERIIR